MASVPIVKLHHHGVQVVFLITGGAWRQGPPEHGALCSGPTGFSLVAGWPGREDDRKGSVAPDR